LSKGNSCLSLLQLANVKKTNAIRKYLFFVID
jgi:hypothetical protein